MTNYRLDPIVTANSVLREFDIDADKPLDIMEIAENLNVRIINKNIRNDVLGACKAEGLKRLVVINPNIELDSRKRFTIAHEIGHIELRHGCKCCSENDFIWKYKIKSTEQDANIFAAELLMPSKSLSKTVKYKNITIDLIESIAEYRQVSVTSTAIKILSLIQDPMVIVYFERGKYKWAFYSKTKKYLNLKTDISIDLIKTMKETKEYDVALFFDDLPEDAVCEAEAKYYSNYDFYLCAIRLDEY